jgi:hypothetical protein
VNKSHRKAGRKMEPTNQTAAVSQKSLWTGRVLSTLATLFMTFDGVIHVLMPPMVVEGFTKAGFPVSTSRPLGIIELLCLALYLIPRTSVLGAVLLTGYLGGAVAVNVRMSMPLFGYVLFPIYVALFFWGGLYLRDDRLRSIFPVRR